MDLDLLVSHYNGEWMLTTRPGLPVVDLCLEGQLRPCGFLPKRDLESLVGETLWLALELVFQSLSLKIKKRTFSNRSLIGSRIPLILQANQDGSSERRAESNVRDGWLVTEA